jgi:hypothetical protein
VLVRCVFFDRNCTRGYHRFPSHACSLEASMRVPNSIPLECTLLLPVDAVNYVRTLTLKARCLFFDCNFAASRAIGIRCTIRLEPLPCV